MEIDIDIKLSRLIIGVRVLVFVILLAFKWRLFSLLCPRVRVHVKLFGSSFSWVDNLNILVREISRMVKQFIDINIRPMEIC